MRLRRASAESAQTCRSGRSGRSRHCQAPKHAASMVPLRPMPPRQCTTTVRPDARRSRIRSTRRAVASVSGAPSRPRRIQEHLQARSARMLSQAGETDPRHLLFLEQDLEHVRKPDLIAARTPKLAATLAGTPAPSRAAARACRQRAEGRCRCRNRGQRCAKPGGAVERAVTCTYRRSGGTAPGFPTTVIAAAKPRVSAGRAHQARPRAAAPRTPRARRRRGGSLCRP